MGRRLALCAAALLIAAPARARAAVSAQDIQLAARVLGFSAKPVTGRVRLGIIYDPASAASAAGEAALVALLGHGFAVGPVTLVPVPVPITAVTSATADVFFLTSGLGAAAARAGAAAAARKIMCITTDAAANAAGDCAVAVQAEPEVSITLNQKAAAASGVSFGTAFMLMITQI